ncbi:MAG: hypothetical protein KDA99_08850 [Planctomycetales bacterium]|nr:hypothetical protein [Planctomycetales bacterium]
MRQLRIELQRSNGIGVSPPGTPTVVKSLLAEGDVLVENRIHDQQGLVAIDRLSVPWLRVEQESGTVTAGGPGWYSTVRADELPMGEIDMQRGLGAVRIEFAGGIAGNLHHREVSFQRAVHAVYGMVTGWDESLRFDDPQPPPGTVLLQCQRLTALAMGRGAGASTAPQRSTLPLGPTVSVGKANVELIAEGNTEVRSDRYAARAHRISYAQSKDLLILEGDGRTDAHIWYNASGSSWQSHAAAQKMKYWRAQNRVNVESGAAIDLLNTARSR